MLEPSPGIQLNPVMKAAQKAVLDNNRYMEQLIKWP
jgi:hypothetical protein